MYNKYRTFGLIQAIFSSLVQYNFLINNSRHLGCFVYFTMNMSLKKVNAWRCGIRFVDRYLTYCHLLCSLWSAIALSLTAK